MREENKPFFPIALPTATHFHRHNGKYALHGGEGGGYVDWKDVYNVFYAHFSIPLAPLRFTEYSITAWGEGKTR